MSNYQRKKIYHIKVSEINGPDQIRIPGDRLFQMLYDRHSGARKHGQLTGLLRVHGKVVRLDAYDIAHTVREHHPFRGLNEAFHAERLFHEHLDELLQLI